MNETKAEILRYLGHRSQSIPQSIHALIDDGIAQMHSAAVPRHARLRFDLSEKDGVLLLEGPGLALPGKDIATHLHGCTQVVLLAATLGASADALIQRWKRTDLTRSLVLDACATQRIEAYCDALEQQIRSEAAASGLVTTARFSPGYGDLPLTLQPHIIDTLDAGRRIGLTCTESCILLPRKSVTALIGLGQQVASGLGGCTVCPMQAACGFRKDGNTDGCSRMAHE